MRSDKDAARATGFGAERPVGNRPRYQVKALRLFETERRFVVGRRGVECPCWIFRTIYGDDLNALCENYEKDRNLCNCHCRAVFRRKE